MLHAEFFSVVLKPRPADHNEMQKRNVFSGQKFKEITEAFRKTIHDGIQDDDDRFFSYDFTDQFRRALRCSVIHGDASGSDFFRNGGVQLRQRITELLPAHIKVFAGYTFPDIVLPGFLQVFHTGTGFSVSYGCLHRRHRIIFYFIKFGLKLLRYINLFLIRFLFFLRTNHIFSFRNSFL